MTSLRSSSGSGGSRGLAGRTLNLLSAAPFGIVLSILLIIACTIGDVYRTKYFNLMLAALGLNLILASIKHIPAARRSILHKELTVAPGFVMAQSFKEKIEMPLIGREQLVERAAAAARAMKFKVRVTPQETQTTIFAERSAWNRLGVYAVQIGLLMILASSIWNNYRGYRGMMWIEPGNSSDKIARQTPDIRNARAPYAAGQPELQLPFTVEGLDIQQPMIDENRPIEMSNTRDWITRLRIRDQETAQETEAVIHMNAPFDYRGHRFLMVSFDSFGNARSIRLKVTPASGGPSEKVQIERNGKIKLPDGAQLHYVEFNPGFAVNSDQEVGSSSPDFANPAARLAYLMPKGEQGQMWAFTEGFLHEISNTPVLKTKYLDAIPYRLILTDFEKAPRAHLLEIQYFPGTSLMHAGFTIFCLALIGVLFFSHQRLWIVVEDGALYLGGNANQNRLGFETRAKKVVTLICEPWTAEN